MGERYNTDAFYPSVFFAFIWQSPFWRIFTLVLVLMEHPSGISAGLSKTLEMFLGLLRSSLTPSDLSSGFRPPHWPCLVTHRLLVPGQLQRLILKWRPVVWVGGFRDIQVDGWERAPSCCCHEGNYGSVNSLMEPVIHRSEGYHTAYFKLPTHTLRRVDTSDSQL